MENLHISCATTVPVSIQLTRIDCLALFSVYMPPANFREQALVWQRSSASFTVTAAAFGPKEQWIKARPFTLRLTLESRGKDNSERQDDHAGRRQSQR